jgi:peptidoglycan/LPS O-acetylase OafA/YrhL
VTEGSRVSYIPALDGLRALAIIAILIFHYFPAGTGWLNGGFIGVEVFFVISGYLITTLLLAEWQKKGSVNMAQFWMRRARRLLPAVFLMIVILVLVSAILPKAKEQLEMIGLVSIAKYTPDLSGELAAIRTQVFAAVFYFSNWYFMLRGGSYFDLTERPSLLEHLWSLSIEEQFYLLWPLLLILGLRFFKDKKTPLIFSILVVAFLSAASMLVNGKGSPSDMRAYFGTDTRAYALMLGAALAILWRPKAITEKSSKIKKAVTDLVGIIGLAVIGYLSWNLTGGELYIFRGGLFLASIATLLVIFAGTSSNSWIVRPVLSSEILRWIGKRSYGLYLWHWPIFILTEPKYNYPLNDWPLFLLRLVILLGITEFSYRYVENPIRRGAIGKYLRNLWSSRDDVWVEAVLRLRLAHAAMVGIIVVGSMFMMCAQTEYAPGLSPAQIIVGMNATSDFAKQNADSASDSDEKAEIISAENITDKREDISLSEKADYEKQNADEKEKIATSDTDASLPVRESVVAVGDSVMLGARKALENEIEGIRVNAVVSRQFPEVFRVVMSLKESGKLPALVVIHTGTNGTIDEKKFVRMMEALHDCKRVAIFNLRVPRSWQEANNKILARVVPQYPNAVLIDWHQESSTRDGIFYKDGIHLKYPKGAAFYASLARKALLESPPTLIHLSQRQSLLIPLLVN